MRTSARGLSLEEYRYALDGKLFKIEGVLVGVGERSVYDGMVWKRYAIFIFPDGSKRLYYGDMHMARDAGNSDALVYFKEWREEYLLKEKSISDRIYLPEEVRLRQDVSKDLEYLDYISTAPNHELQREFDMYKKVAPFWDMPVNLEDD
jgi:hypothetical protein